MKAFFDGMDCVFSTVVPLPKFPPHLAFHLGVAFAYLVVICTFLFAIVLIGVALAA